MAQQGINLLQLYQPKSWAGLTTENHLATAYMEHPQLVSDVISRVFGMNQYRGLEYLLAKIGTKTVETDREYEWYLKGDDRKAVVIIGFDATNLLQPGINKTIFKLKLAEKLFGNTDKLIFDDRNYSVRVMSEPYPDGSNWVYEVQIMKPDSTAFIPPYLLANGKKVSKIYSPQERTLNKTYGTTSFSSPFKMRNFFSTLGKKYTVPANVHDRPLVISMLDPLSNQRTNVWTKYAEWEMLAQWVREKENNLIYSEYNQNIDGTFSMFGESNFPIIEGAGLRQQISPAYKFYYNNFTVDYLLEVLLNLSINILPEDNRKFIALTGERGMIQFHKAIESKVGLFQPVGVGPSQRVFGSGQNLGFGGQYVEFKGPQGVDFTLVNLPQYNDLIDNRLPHPDGGYTENYRYTILNFGTTEGEPNITKLYPKNGNKMWHVAGSTTPYGPNTSFNTGSASAVDGYELFTLTTQGIMIKNPMSCAELIYSSTGASQSQPYYSAE
jgi:hypothetical protein